MMHRVIYAPEAEAQLIALFFQIAATASPEIAVRYTDAIADQCESLKTFPLRGARRRVSIAFEVTSDDVTILGIFYRGQNFEAAYEE